VQNVKAKQNKTITSAAWQVINTAYESPDVSFISSNVQSKSILQCPT